MLLTTRCLSASMSPSAILPLEGRGGRYSTISTLFLVDLRINSLMIERLIQDTPKDLAQRLGFFLTLVLSSSIDVVFLAGWVFIQSLADPFISSIKLHDVEAGVIVICRYVFATATVVPVLLFIFLDVRLMITKTKAIYRKKEAELIRLEGSKQ